MPRPVDSDGPSHPSHLRMVSYCLRRSLKPSASAKTSSRSCTSTSGSAISPTAYGILCLRFTRFVRRHPCRLRHRRKTRYGWVASPYPTGTSTPKDMPSFARRDNGEVRGRATRQDSRRKDAPTPTNRCLSKRHLNSPVSLHRHVRNG